MAQSFYYGMDISYYPGDDVMKDWRQGSPFSYTGFYLAPAPYHKDTSWMSKRTFLTGLGWGLVPTYLGLQADSQHLSDAQGKADAQNASSLAKEAGFPKEAYIYLDVEQGGEVSAQFITYIKAWVNEIIVNTPYRPGIYCSYYQTADQIKSACQNNSELRYWVFNINKVHDDTAPAPNPADSGVSYVTAWQFAQNIKKTYGSHTLTIDISTSNLQDPSKL